MDPHKSPSSSDAIGSDAKARLAAVITSVADDDVVLIRHSRPVAVIMSTQRHAAMLEEIEDLKDRLSIAAPEGVTMDFEKLVVEMGIDVV